MSISGSRNSVGGGRDVGRRHKTREIKSVHPFFGSILGMTICHPTESTTCVTNKRTFPKNGNFFPFAFLKLFSFETKVNMGYLFGGLVFSR